MKCAAFVPVARKPGTELAIIPVGVAVLVEPAGGGMVTTTDWIAPTPLYKVERPDRLSETQNGLVPLKAIPQGLRRFVSVRAVSPETLETRLLWTNAFCDKAILGIKVPRAAKMIIREEQSFAAPEAALAEARLGEDG